MNGPGIQGTQASCTVCSFTGGEGLFLLKMAFFILKVEEETAEAAETDAEGIIFSSVMSNYSEPKQATRCPVRGEMQLLPPRCSLLLLQRGPAWADGAFLWLKPSHRSSAMAMLPSAAAGSKRLVFARCLLTEQALMRSKGSSFD